MRVAIVLVLLGGSSAAVASPPMCNGPLVLASSAGSGLLYLASLMPIFTASQREWETAVGGGASHRRTDTSWMVEVGSSVTTGHSRVRYGVDWSNRFSAGRECNDSELQSRVAPLVWVPFRASRSVELLLGGGPLASFYGSGHGHRPLVSFALGAELAARLNIRVSSGTRLSAALKYLPHHLWREHKTHLLHNVRAQGQLQTELESVTPFVQLFVELGYSSHGVVGDRVPMQPVAGLAVGFFASHREPRRFEELE